MNTGHPHTICKSCGKASSGEYCPHCGQKMAVHRLSVHELAHEVFHFFTHVDHGILYTLKKLVVTPGKMQKEFVEGNRMKHQKPFSMFFLTATLCALIVYWVDKGLRNYYHIEEADETQFFHQYWVLFQAVLLPLYAVIVYLCFRKAGYNYGEILVYQLYTFSFLFLLLALIHLLKLISPHLETRYVELPLFIGYTMITNLNFFTQMKKWAIVIISLVSITLIFLFASWVQDETVRLMYSK